MARHEATTSTTDIDLLRELCAAPSPTGFEGPVQAVVRRRLSATATVEGDPTRLRQAVLNLRDMVAAWPELFEDDDERAQEVFLECVLAQCASFMQCHEDD